MRLFIAHILDKFDHAVLKHRFDIFCRFVTWIWPEYTSCECEYCMQFFTSNYED